MADNPPPEASYWTSIGQKYEDAFGNVPGQIRAVDWAIKQLLSQRKEAERKIHVIDFGCGTGKPTCAQLAAAADGTAFEVLGLDVAPGMVEVGRKEVSSVYSNAKFEVADLRTWSPSASTIGYKSNGDGGEEIQVDGVFAFFSLLSGVKQADIREFFHRAIRWVRPGGVLIYGTVAEDREEAPMRFLGQDMFVSSLVESENKKEIEAAGWNIEKMESEVFHPRGVEIGLCPPEESEPEEHLFIYCTKPEE